MTATANQAIAGDLDDLKIEKKAVNNIIGIQQEEEKDLQGKAACTPQSNAPLLRASLIKTLDSVACDVDMKKVHDMVSQVMSGTSASKVGKTRLLVNHVDELHKVLASLDEKECNLSFETVLDLAEINLMRNHHEKFKEDVLKISGAETKLKTSRVNGKTFYTELQNLIDKGMSQKINEIEKELREDSKKSSSYQDLRMLLVNQKNKLMTVFDREDWNPSRRLALIETLLEAVRARESLLLENRNDLLKSPKDYATFKVVSDVFLPALADKRISTFTNESNVSKLLSSKNNSWVGKILNKKDNSFISGPQSVREILSRQSENIQSVYSMLASEYLNGLMGEKGSEKTRDKNKERDARNAIHHKSKQCEDHEKRLNEEVTAVMTANNGRSKLGKLFSSTGKAATLEKNSSVIEAGLQDSVADHCTVSLETILRLSELDQFINHHEDMKKESIQKKYAQLNTYLASVMDAGRKQYYNELFQKVEKGTPEKVLSHEKKSWEEKLLALDPVTRLAVIDNLVKGLDVQDISKTNQVLKGEDEFLKFKVITDVFLATLKEKGASEFLSGNTKVSGWVGKIVSDQGPGKVQDINRKINEKLNEIEQVYLALGDNYLYQLLGGSNQALSSPAGTDLSAPGTPVVSSKSQPLASPPLLSEIRRQNSGSQNSSSSEGLSNSSQAQPLGAPPLLSKSAHKNLPNQPVETNSDVENGE